MRQSICSAANRRSSETWKTSRSRRQAGRRVRKHVLPSRFLIGLSRASDETRRKGLLNPSTPQLLIGLLARRGRLARRPPRRRPSELAPLGPFDPSAGLERGQRRTARDEGPEEVLHGQDEDAVAQEALLPAVEQDRYPFVVNENPPSLMADLLRFRQLEWRISGHGSRKGAPPGEGAWRGVRRAGDRGATFCPVVVSSCCRPAANGGTLPPEPGQSTKGHQDPRTTVSRPSFLRRPGRDLLSCRRFVLLSTGRGGGGGLPRNPAIADPPIRSAPRLSSRSAGPFPHAKFAKFAKGAAAEPFREGRRPRRPHCGLSAVLWFRNDEMKADGHG